MRAILSPEEYASVSTYDLLRAAALCQVGLDHRLLRVILDRGDAALPDILRFFQEDREDDRIDLDEDLLNIARQLRTPAAVPFLIEYARESGDSFPEELTLAFVELGPAAVEPLLKLHKHANLASDVAFTLAALGVRDPRVLELLVRELEASPHEGAINLGLYGDPAAKPALEAALAKAGDDADRRAIAAAIEDLDSGKPNEPPEPFDIWAKYPEREEPLFGVLEDDELKEFLRSPLAEYRAHAVRSLGMGHPDPETVAKILNFARTDPDVEVRADSWEALEQNVDEPEVGKAMKSRLNDASVPDVERAGIAAAMAADYGREEPLHGAIRELYAVPEARARAIRAMWHSLDRRFAQYIPPHLDDPDPEVRTQAVAAVGWLGIVSQLKRIEQLFDEEDLRGPALYAYSLAAPGEVTPARTRSLFRKIEDLAGGLSENEGALVRKALDDRLQLHGQEPIFNDSESWEEDEEEEPEPAAKIGRNDPCPCGSGKKYKKCCGALQ
jgi:HEAT repeat protein